MQGLKKLEPEKLPTPGNPKTLVVSSAAGSTGSYVAQIAKHKGYQVVGIVGNSQKIDFVKNLGAVNCVDYSQAKDP